MGWRRAVDRNGEKTTTKFHWGPCRFFSSLKTLPMPKQPTKASPGVNVPGLTYGRFSANP